MAPKKLGCSNLGNSTPNRAPIIHTSLATVLFLLVLEAALLPAESASRISQDHQGFDRQFDHQKMDQTLRQLGELLLGAVPTVILLATLYILYTFLVHRSEERRAEKQGRKWF